MDKKGGVSRYSVENILAHNAESFRRGILCCCINFGYPEILDGTGAGVSIFSNEKFLSHRAENFRRGILHCCISSGYRKSLDKKGEYQDIPSKNFCLTVPRISVEEYFTVALISVTENFWI